MSNERLKVANELRRMAEKAISIGGPRKVILQRGGVDQLEQELLGKTQAYINESDNEQNAWNGHFSNVVGSAIRHGGLPTDPTGFAARCALVTDALADLANRRRWNRLKQAYEAIPNHQPTSHIVWGAQIAGVTLTVDRVADEAAPTPPGAAAPAADSAPAVKLE